MNLQTNREDRLVYFLSSVISEEDARKVYNRLDELADRACVAVDDQIYDYLVYESVIVDYR